MAINKNQHFVPRCYLKAFTDNGTNRSINVFNLERLRAIPSAPVKNQCSGSYFYGQDDNLEAGIRLIEQSYAAVVSRIHGVRYRLTDSDKNDLRVFMLFQHLRTEAASRRSVEMFAEMENSIGTPWPELKPSIKEAVQIAMRAFADAMHLFDDLKLCLIKNKTTRPFLTSDDPAVVTNRWHKEDLRVKHESPGLQSSGIAVFLPLSPRVMCVAYDGDVYSIPHDGGWAEIKNASDVEAFNEQQFLNAFANIYFHDWSEHEWAKSTYLAVKSGRLQSRHRINYAVLDGNDGLHKRYRVVESFDAEEHTEALIHTQSLLPTPSRWPTPLKWRKKGCVYDSGTGMGYVRAAFHAFGGLRRVTSGR
jgi:hypothetical protein